MVNRRRRPGRGRVNVTELLAKRRPPQVTVQIVFDGALQDEMTAVQEQIRKAEADSQGLRSEAPKLQEQLTALQARVEEAAVPFTFQAIPRSELEALKAAHPPTVEQWTRFKEESAGQSIFAQPPQFDWVGFAPGLIASSCINPQMSVEEAQRLWDELSDGEAATLFEAAWRVQGQVSRPFSLGNGIDMTPDSVPKSTTPSNTVSPSPST